MSSEKQNPAHKPESHCVVIHSYGILYYCCYFLLQVRLLHQGEHSANTLSPRDGSSDSHPLWNFQQNIFRRGNCNSMWPDNRRRLVAMCMYVLKYGTHLWKWCYISETISDPLLHQLWNTLTKLIWRSSLFIKSTCTAYIHTYKAFCIFSKSLLLLHLKKAFHFVRKHCQKYTLEGFWTTASFSVHIVYWSSWTVHSQKSIKFFFIHVQHF